MNSDGAPVFRSSKVSIWPVFLIINELLFHLRIAKENMIFPGLWFSDRKPLMTSFLKPIFSHLNELESGVEVESPQRGKYKLRAALIACTCDLPASSLSALWTHANFTFEDKIRLILKFIHGSELIDSQIVTAVSFTQKIPELIEDFANENGDIKNLKDQLSSNYLPKSRKRYLKMFIVLESFPIKLLLKRNFVGLQNV